MTKDSIYTYMCADHYFSKVDERGILKIENRAKIGQLGRPVSQSEVPVSAVDAQISYHAVHRF